MISAIKLYIFHRYHKPNMPRQALLRKLDPLGTLSVSEVRDKIALYVINIIPWSFKAVSDTFFLENVPKNSRDCNVYWNILKCSPIKIVILGRR